MHSHSIITYIVVLPDEPRGDSAFQGFAFRLLDAAKTIRSVLRLPATFIEMYLPRDAVVAERAMSGGYQIIPRDVSTLERLPGYPAARFLVVISGPGTDEATATCVARSELPALHVTTTESSEILRLDRLTVEDLRAYCGRAIGFIKDHYGTFVIPDLNIPPGDEPVVAPLHATGHFVALPNEIALESLGYKLKPRKLPVKPLTVLSS